MGELWCQEFCSRGTNDEGTAICPPKWWNLPNLCNADAAAAQAAASEIADKFCARNCRADPGDTDCHMRDTPDDPDEDIPGVPTFKGKQTYRLGTSEWQTAHEEGEAICNSLCDPRTTIRINANPGKIYKCVAAYAN